jgi:hypothetical protein
MSPRWPALLLCALAAGGARAETLEVPGQYPSVQAAIDAAGTWDVVSIAKRRYRENVLIAGKAVVLQSALPPTGDPYDHPVIDGEAEEPEEGPAPPPLPTITLRDRSVVTIRGLTIEGGAGGIRVEGGSVLDLIDSTVHENDGHGVELLPAEQGGWAWARGYLLRSVVAGNGGNGVQAAALAVLSIRDSRMDSNFDGVHLQLPAEGENPSGGGIEHEIRDSVFSRNARDAIRLVDAEGLSEDSVRIERCVLERNGGAALHMTCPGSGSSPLESCPVSETVRVVRSTIVGNAAGIVGGADVIAVGNLFSENGVGAKDVSGDSLLAYNLFHDGVDYEGSNVEPATTLSADPLLSEDPPFSGRHLPAPTSPAVDAGISYFQAGGEDVLSIGFCEWTGAAPDLGVFERDFGYVGVPLTAGADDGEESGRGKVNLTRKEIRLASDGFEGWAGFRFPGLAIPPGSQILSAFVQFEAARKGVKPAQLLIAARGTGAPFATTPLGLSGPGSSGPSVRWSPPPWLRKGDAQRTPDLSSVVQHVVDEPGWNEGDALALLTWGTGKRTVGASDAGASTLLYVEYDAGVLDVELPCRLFP